MKREDASKLLRVKKKLKIYDLIQKCFLPNAVVFIKESVFLYYKFLSNVKGSGPKNGSFHSGSQMGPFESKEMKSPSQYWLLISASW